MNPLAISVSEAGRLLGISRNLAYEAAKSGEIPTVRIGRRLVVPISQLSALLDPPQANADPKADALIPHLPGHHSKKATDE